MSNTIAKTPKPPYYAVIFTSLRTEGDRGYGHMAGRMVELAAQQPGFLGVESARTTDGLGITVSYWLQRTRPSRSGCNSRLSQAGSLSLDRLDDVADFIGHCHGQPN
jgi:hypothetical protein